MSIYDSWKNEVSDSAIAEAEKAAAEAAENNYQKAPAGTYDVSVSKLELRDSTFDDSKQIWIAFKVLDGEYKGASIDFNGAFRDHFAKGFVPTAKLLAALAEEPEAEPVIQSILRTEDYEKINDLLLDISEGIDGAGFTLKYEVTYSGQNPYKNNEPYENKFFHIEEVFDLD